MSFKLEECTIAEIHNAYENNELTCVELTQLYLSRIEKLDQAGPSLNAFVKLDPSALDQARILDDYYQENGKFKGVLHGVPLAIKDQAETKNLETSFGSKALIGNIPEEDATIVKKLKDAGAIIVGKTTMPDFAASWWGYGSVHGETKCAYDLERDSGGSSGGTGAAVAANLVTVGIGEDTGGSIRLPSSANNLVGIRVTPGMISRNGLSPLLVLLDTAGPMARNVTDLSILLDAMAKYNHLDPLSIKKENTSFYESLGKETKHIYKVGITEDFGIYPCTSEIKNMIVNTSKLITSIGHEVDASFPSMQNAEESFQILRAYLFFSVYGFLLSSHKNVRKDIIWNIEKGKNLDVSDIVKADNIRARIYQNIANFFNEFDFLVCPSSSVVPFNYETKWVKQINEKTFDNYVSWLMICGSLSLVNCPCISLPTSIAENGAPIGIQIIAPPHHEEKLLKFAKSLETEINIADLVPINPKNA